jgi:hypothetical protein
MCIILRVQILTTRYKPDPRNWSEDSRGKNEAITGKEEERYRNRGLPIIYFLFNNFSFPKIRRTKTWKDLRSYLFVYCNNS